MDEKTGKVFSIILILLAALGALWIGLLFLAFPFYAMWNWFISPVFVVNAITFSQSLMLAFMFYFFLATIKMFSKWE